ncbi:hypothetical protein N7488_012309 [Penicillium malachiteum]|nr:hypothetical protein N7488_012309 [Penicillium malachiteum]
MEEGWPQDPSKNGNEINIRDRAEGILNAAMKASEVITTAVSFDLTGYASTAWTVISFGMSVLCPLQTSLLYIAYAYVHVNYRFFRTDSTVATPFSLPPNILQKSSPTIR